MEAVLSKDAEYSDNYLDFSANDKRLIRVGVKSYQKTGEYITLKLFKRESSDSSYSFNQKITLSSDEFQTFLEKLNKIKRMLAQNKPKTERNEKERQDGQTGQQPPSKKHKVDDKNKIVIDN